MERISSISIAVTVGAAFFVLALLFWYLLEWIVKRKGHPMSQQDPPKPTPLETQVDQLLTEARVIIPGVQALLGFQLTVTLTRAFQELPGDAKVAHAIALCCIGIAISPNWSRCSSDSFQPLVVSIDDAR